MRVKTGLFIKKGILVKNVLTNHLLKSFQKQEYADVLQNKFFRNFPVFAGKHLPCELQLYLKETSTHVFSCEYCKKFYSKPPVASVDFSS